MMQLWRHQMSTLHDRMLDRRRKQAGTDLRPNIWLLVSMMALMVMSRWDRAEAWSGTSVRASSARRRSPLTATASLTEERIRTSVDQEALGPFPDREFFMWQDYGIFRDEEDDDDDDDWDLQDYFQLQEATGAEVIDENLQQQIDQPLLVHSDLTTAGAPSELERLAMASVPQQLPKPMAAVTRNVHQKRTIKKMRVMSNDLNFVKAERRVTVQQEQILARAIQEGAALFRLKAEAEEELGRPLSRQEWAERAGKTSKDIRRQVSLYRQAKHELVTANMGLVHTVVRQMWPLYRPSGISREEMVQEGSLGLLRAAELFDPSRGLRFSTYAVVWIKGILGNSHLPELVRVPSREKSKWNKIVQAGKQLAMSGEKPTPEQLAAWTGLTVTEVLETERKMSQAQQVLSLDYEYVAHSRSGADSSKQENYLHNDKAFQQDADVAEQAQLHADLIAAMARNLDAREARLMRLRYGLHDGIARSLQECADAMGLSYTRVHQLSNRCLKKLREAAEAESLEEYLLTVA